MMLIVMGFLVQDAQAEFRDPTLPAYPLPPIQAEGSGSGLGSNNYVPDLAAHIVLTAIWQSSSTRRATINGTTVAVGETITFEPASVNDQTKNVNSALVISRQKPGTVSKKKQGKESVLAFSRKASDELAMQTTDEGVKKQNEAAEKNQRRGHSLTIRVVAINKNSVIIEQDGERKTLDLLQRSYQTH